MSDPRGSTLTESASPSQGEQLKLAGAQLLDAARDRIRHTIDLAAAEARLAAMSGLSMVVMMAMVAAALIVAWGLIVATTGYYLVLAGVPLAAAAGLLVAAQLVLAWLLWRATAKLSRNLTLPELRNAMTSSGDGPPAET